jgi:hypothetical protein
MRVVLFILAGLYWVAAQKEGEKWYRPSFCKDRDCPHFKTQLMGDLEVRNYEGSYWATVSHLSDSPTKSLFHSYHILFSYFHGQNSEQKRIPMTVPVILYIPSREESSHGIRNFTTGFFLPDYYQNDISSLPHPQNSQIKITKCSEKRVAVEGFQGYAVKRTTQDALKRLVRKLLVAEQSYKEGYVLAVYDNPFKLLHRHNEVWIELKTQEE